MASITSLSICRFLQLTRPFCKLNCERACGPERQQGARRHLHGVGVALVDESDVAEVPAPGVRGGADAMDEEEEDKEEEEEEEKETEEEEDDEERDAHMPKKGTIGVGTPL